EKTYPERPMMLAAQMHVGPLPAADELRKYNDVLPGLANRIVVMTESQSAHRQKIENKKINFRFLGQVFAFVICMTAIITGFFLILRGYHIEGSIFSGTGLAAILAVFLVERFTERK